MPLACRPRARGPPSSPTSGAPPSDAPARASRSPARRFVAPPPPHGKRAARPEVREDDDMAADVASQRSPARRFVALPAASTARKMRGPPGDAGHHAAAVGRDRRTPHARLVHAGIVAGRPFTGAGASAPSGSPPFGWPTPRPAGPRGPASAAPPRRLRRPATAFPRPARQPPPAAAAASLGPLGRGCAGRRNFRLPCRLGPGPECQPATTGGGFPPTATAATTCLPAGHSSRCRAHRRIGSRPAAPRTAASLTNVSSWRQVSSNGSERPRLPSRADLFKL